MCCSDPAVSGSGPAAGALPSQALRANRTRMNALISRIVLLDSLSVGRSKATVRPRRSLLNTSLYAGPEQRDAAFSRGKPACARRSALGYSPDHCASRTTPDHLQEPGIPGAYERTVA